MPRKHRMTGNHRDSLGKKVQPWPCLKGNEASSNHQFSDMLVFRGVIMWNKKRQHSGFQNPSYWFEVSTTKTYSHYRNAVLTLAIFFSNGSHQAAKSLVDVGNVQFADDQTSILDSMKQNPSQLAVECAGKTGGWKIYTPEKSKTGGNRNIMPEREIIAWDWSWMLNFTLSIPREFPKGVVSPKHL